MEMASKLLMSIKVLVLLMGQGAHSSWARRLAAPTYVSCLSSNPSSRVWATASAGWVSSIGPPSVT